MYIGRRKLIKTAGGKKILSFKTATKKIGFKVLFEDSSRLGRLCILVICSTPQGQH